MDSNEPRTDGTGSLMDGIKYVVSTHFRKSGLMQEPLAKRIGINPVSLSKLLSGKRTIYADELVRLIVELAIPLPEIFGADLWREYERKMATKAERERRQR